MSSLSALRACMQGIVLLNLVFVELTGAAGWHWLGPLFALTIAEPYLRRVRRALVYRVLWNGGVVAFFFVLLRHALQAELAYVLEDGLVLAALCQVHLLNNLSSDQRPDLLFFNAFLIAMITGFMTRGIGFPIAFLVFVPCYVIGLQLQSATRDGHEPAAHATRRLMTDAFRRGAFVLGASLFVFLFWPRDFERKALFSGKFDFPTAGPGRVGIGYNEEVIHALRQNVASNNRRALVVELLDGDPATLSPLWRGATLSITDGLSWRPTEPGLARDDSNHEEPWRGARGQLVRHRPAEGPQVRVEVLRLEQDTERLFAPLGAYELRLADAHRGALLRSQPDGTIDIAETTDVRYELHVAVRPPELGGAPVTPVPDGLAQWVALPEKARDFEPAIELAGQLADEVSVEGEQHELVSHFREELESRFRYTEPGNEGAASLAQFLDGKPGHCELFASALAVMLRSQGVPCRLVTGFRAGDWDATQNVLNVGTRNAHAWVEVLDPTGGWYAVDPSPLSIDGALPGDGLWARLQEKARSFWSSVTGFDSERRAAVVAWVQELPARVWELLRTRPFLSFAFVALSGALIGLRLRHRSRGTAPEVRLYARVLRRNKLSLELGETPRELLARARLLELGAEDLSVLERVTREHELARYGAQG